MEPSILVAIITTLGAVIVAFIQLRSMNNKGNLKKPQENSEQVTSHTITNSSSTQELSPIDEKLGLWEELSDTIVIVYGAKYNRDKDKEGHLSLSLRDLNAAQAIHTFLVGKYPKKDYPNKNFILMPSLANGWQTLLKENTDLIIIGGFVVNDEFNKHRSSYQKNLRIKMGRLCHVEERHVFHIDLANDSLRDQPHKIEELPSKFVTQDFALVSRMKISVYGARRNVITIAGIKGHGTLGAASHLASVNGKVELNNIGFKNISDFNLELVLKTEVLDNLLDKTEIIEIVVNGKSMEALSEINPVWRTCELSPLTNPCQTCTFGEILPNSQIGISLITKNLDLKGIIFDLDDTLIDTFASLIVPLEYEAAKKMVLLDNKLNDHAYLASTILELRKKDPSNIEKLLEKQLFVKPEALAKRSSVIDNLQKIKFDKLIINPEVKRLLQELKSKNQLRLFLVTEGDALFQNRKINHLGIGELFSEVSIIASDDNKESVIKSLMKSHGLDSNQLLVIGNRLDKEIIAGNKLGIRTVWIKHGEGSNPSSENQNGTPDYILDNILQAETLLDNILHH